MSKLFAEAAANTQQEWANNVVDKFSLGKWLEYLGLTVAQAVTIFYFFVGGFFVGFAFKKYFKFLIGCIFTVVVLAIVLESRNLITIDWSGIKSLLGLDPAHSDLNSLAKMVWDWVYANLHQFIGVTAGFIVGYKLG